MASVQLPREEALDKESEYAIQLFTSYQSKALQYAFFAERAATKVCIGTIVYFIHYIRNLCNREFNYYTRL